ncbi:hypothetical protein PPTG_19855 [Phytophthora nicotianae INRA-310]|uniref:Uncharacterized protein n=2 Tax=Phytophthora nicotianae TaxID=4792 RepID=W2PB25_PHYN3|nr:hypothetical protein PPTG_19855 [Phytophthora nicotianae INRA-310]ETM98031.1 hypothetical protein PPTG_19855 [Phytophthora nicotianae INRA-310]KUF76100.1 hypothetical protein AM587_10014993 [Phytophthora nicotianae]
MPRPILKMRSSYASPLRSPASASKREKRSITVRRHNGACRRVTFSPFTKLRGDSSTSSQLPLLADGEETKGSLTSGFTFSSATEAEKKWVWTRSWLLWVVGECVLTGLVLDMCCRNQSRRRQELETMKILYRAARHRPHSVKSLLLTNVPGLKRLNTFVSDWVDYAKTVRGAMPWPQRTRPKRRPRRLHRGPWTELDDADHNYVQKLARSSKTSHPSLLLPSSTSPRDDNPLDIVLRSPQPDLTPPNRGSFTNLLRKEGIPVEEDERHVNRAIDEDLRGVCHPVKHQRLQR